MKTRVQDIIGKIEERKDGTKRRKNKGAELYSEYYKNTKTEEIPANLRGRRRKERSLTARDLNARMRREEVNNGGRRIKYVDYAEKEQKI